MLSEKDEWAVTVAPDFSLEIRKITTVYRDAEAIAQTNWRVALAPGSDVSTYPEVVTTVAAAVWTPEVVAEWNAKKEAQANALPA